MLFFKILFNKGFWKINKQQLSRLQKIKIGIMTFINGLVCLLSFGTISFWGDVALAIKYHAQKK